MQGKRAHVFKALLPPWVDALAGRLNQLTEQKASRLIQTGVRTAIIHASNDEHSNISLHPHFWGTILGTPVGPPPGGRSPTVHLIVRDFGHGGCEEAVFGIRRGDEAFEDAWNFVLSC